MRHLSILSEPHGEQGLKYSRRLEFEARVSRIRRSVTTGDGLGTLAKNEQEDRVGAEVSTIANHFFFFESFIRPSLNQAQS